MNTWRYLPSYRQMVRILDCHTVFGQKTCQIWLPNEERVITVREEDFGDAPHLSLAEICYRALAGRIIQALNQDVLLAPLEGQIEPMPHQFAVLERVIYGGQGRLLLADEVGLGKTIEAGLVIRELKLRGLIQRILIVTPKGLMQQWKSELWMHFDETFWLITGEDIKRVDGNQPEELWLSHDQVIVSHDSIKPLAKRAGWETTRIVEYNRKHFDAVTHVPWDLIIIDEAHRLGGSTDYVARFRLGQALAMASPYLLLLSATPHQGKSDQFVRLLSLLDAERFIDAEHMTPEDVRPYVIRTAKRQALALDGTPLFKPRIVELILVDWSDSQYHAQRAVYEAVSDYVRNRYQKAMRAKQFSQAFLLILMQRLVTSSPAAILRAIERRLQVLEGREEDEDETPIISEYEEDNKEIMAGSVLSGERQHLLSLKDLALTALNHADARLDRLLRLIDQLREKETSEIKLLIFTEFLPTQAMLERMLKEAGYRVSILNGQMSLEERILVQEEFRDASQILISTDAGGEGLNLQFAHVVINYDLPWNPMKIEQRIGRVDRIGQTHDVWAFNFVLQDTVEARVHQVLLEKLQRILDEMGIDKLGDVLDSSGMDVNYPNLFMESLMAPERTDQYLNEFVESVEMQAKNSRNFVDVISALPPDLEKVSKALGHPFPEWVEAMTEQYVMARGGMVERRLFGIDIHFPDGEVISQAVFRKRDRAAQSHYVGIHHPRIASLIDKVPRVTPGEAFVILVSSQFPQGLKGLWSLWKLTLQTREKNRSRLIPVFVSEDGKRYRTTAQKIWEQICQPEFQGEITFREGLSDADYDALRQVAEEEARPLYQELTASHQAFLQRERDKARKAFRIRAQMAEHVGLPEVREFRLKRLRQELDKRQVQLDHMAKTIPQFTPLLIVEVKSL
ncbi:DEAD/DEAH box helicase [Sulfobacillus thermosulfidooxidans]|uniref:DEAD/DEAH box helicase n=1 Tax=Sulfobacillus thermosulfidooxidans TaxID=28034 RepID=UPI0006B57DF3|nr:helicase-related protein [Sulfobacillus thermosulfidooxidans]